VLLSLVLLLLWLLLLLLLLLLLRYYWWSFERCWLLQNGCRGHLMKWFLSMTLLNRLSVG